MSVHLSACLSTFFEETYHIHLGQADYGSQSSKHESSAGGKSNEDDCNYLATILSCLG